MTENILTAIIISVSSALLGWIGTLSYKGLARHSAHHKILELQPKLTEENKKEHGTIFIKLEKAEQINIALLKTQIMHLAYLIRQKPSESDNEKMLFYELYSLYEQLGGNGFIHEVKKKIDEL